MFSEFAVSFHAKVVVAPSHSPFLLRALRLKAHKFVFSSELLLTPKKFAFTTIVNLFRQKTHPRKAQLSIFRAVHVFLLVIHLRNNLFIMALTRHRIEEKHKMAQKYFVVRLRCGDQTVPLNFFFGRLGRKYFY